MRLSRRKSLSGQMSKKNDLKRFTPLGLETFKEQLNFNGGIGNVDLVKRVGSILK